MSVILRKRKNEDGSISLRLDIYHQGQRYYEPLKNLKLYKASNLRDRENNKELLRQAESIRVARAAELDANGYNLVSDSGRKTIVTEWMQSYVDKYTKSDKRNMQGALKKFIAMLTEKKKAKLTFANLTPLIIEDYLDYLEERHTGEGVNSYFKRVKKMVKHAYRRRLMKDNILDQVERRPSGKSGKKDFLTLEEIKTLIATPTEGPEVRRAAIFSLMTGLAWVDLKKLTWRQIDLKNKKLKHLKRSKTSEAIEAPLNDTAIKILGDPENASDLVFSLPTANGANKTLKAWVKRAGIDKKITWHNLRHSAGTNLAYQGTDILTISKILAHSSTRVTERYVRAAEELKIKATDGLNVDL